MCAKYNSHANDLFNKLGIRKLDDVYKVNVGKFIFSYMKKELPLPTLKLTFLLISKMIICSALETNAINRPDTKLHFCYKQLHNTFISWDHTCKYKKKTMLAVACYLY